MEKLERLGCSKSWSVWSCRPDTRSNLDGTNIYMTLATLFIAQALGVDLTLWDQLTILVVAMLTSKGASGVTGAGFITLAATLTVVNPALVPGMANRVLDRQVHERGAGPDQHHRQRRRYECSYRGGKANSTTSGCTPLSIKRSTCRDLKTAVTTG